MAEKGDPGPKSKFGSEEFPALPPEDSPRRCVAHNKHGKRCKQWAIKGGTVCRFHGGATKHVKEAAARRIERQQAEETVERGVAMLGLPRDVEPAVALMEELHRTAGHVSWLGEYVGGLDEVKVTGGVSKLIEMPDGQRRKEVSTGINAWVKLYQEERAHLARVAKMAIEAGIAERQVRIVEAQAELMAGALRRILDRLGVANHPDAPRIVREEMSRLADPMQNGRPELAEVSGGGGD